MNDITPVTSCSQERYEVRSNDLPLSCPMPKMTLWDGHPKVYLDIQSNGEVSCPYCGALYVLVE
jgi:uncharacterized Zn-finger protein